VKSGSTPRNSKMRRIAAARSSRRSSEARTRMRSIPYARTNGSIWWPYMLVSRNGLSRSAKVDAKSSIRTRFLATLCRKCDTARSIGSRTR
jgi:hypothetical protein